jgi:hypothetical protein
MWCFCMKEKMSKRQAKLREDRRSDTKIQMYTVQQDAAIEYHQPKFSENMAFRNRREAQWFRR